MRPAASVPPAASRRSRCAAAPAPSWRLVALALAACGGNADPFVGLYWEPSTSRRVEIRKDGDEYWLYYGAALQPYQADRDGDELRIAEPMGGQTIVRPGDDRGHAGAARPRARPRCSSGCSSTSRARRIACPDAGGVSRRARRAGRAAATTLSIAAVGQTSVQAKQRTQAASS